MKPLIDTVFCRKCGWYSLDLDFADCPQCGYELELWMQRPMTLMELLDRNGRLFIELLEFLGVGKLVRWLNKKLGG